MEYNINRIKNETIQKLTAEEIGELGLVNRGVMLYKGTLKSRRQGWKTEKVGDRQTNFISQNGFRVEFIRIQQVREEPEWAMRIFNIQNDSYSTLVHPLAGLDFLK